MGLTLQSDLRDCRTHTTSIKQRITLTAKHWTPNVLHATQPHNRRKGVQAPESAAQVPCGICSFRRAITHILRTAKDLQRHRGHRRRGQRWLPLSVPNCPSALPLNTATHSPVPGAGQAHYLLSINRTGGKTQATCTRTTTCRCSFHSRSVCDSRKNCCTSLLWVSSISLFASARIS